MRFDPVAQGSRRVVDSADMARKNEGPLLALAFVGFLFVVAGALVAVVVGPRWLQGIVITGAGAFAIWGRAAFAQIGLGHTFPSMRPAIAIYAVLIGCVLIVVGCLTLARGL
jgi:hypothetical protein